MANGLDDLFEYGMEFAIGGNALGDGKPKNSTTDEQNETFQQKYRKELKKDLEDIENEDIEEETTEGEEADSESEGGETVIEVELDGDGEEFVSASDMFNDEM